MGRLSDERAIVAQCRRHHVFFCASQFDHGWEYFYVGVGTIREALSREDVWQDARYEPYRRFYNILARPAPAGWQQSETFHEFHNDWRRRIEAPYFLFDPDRTHFNMVNPLLVGTYLKEIGAPERWRKRTHSSKGWSASCLRSVASRAG